jgi:hypothetical protein
MSTSENCAGYHIARAGKNERWSLVLMVVGVPLDIPGFDANSAAL